MRTGCDEKFYLEKKNISRQRMRVLEHFIQFTRKTIVMENTIRKKNLQNCCFLQLILEEDKIIL